MADPNLGTSLGWNEANAPGSPSSTSPGGTTSTPTGGTTSGTSTDGSFNFNQMPPSWMTPALQLGLMSPTEIGSMSQDQLTQLANQFGVGALATDWSPQQQAAIPASDTSLLQQIAAFIASEGLTPSVGGGEGGPEGEGGQGGAEGGGGGPGP
jgi:hypothetical protein